MPVAFVPHGGGPWPFVDVGFPTDDVAALAAYLKSVRSLPPENPKALLVVSGHWEEPAPTLMTSAQPPMLYDYYGFPPESYRISWPAPGAPWLAPRVRELLAADGFTTLEDSERGYDHGTFIPLKLTYPEAQIPVLQVSLIDGLDAARHIALGRALAPLRDEGIFIIASGMTFHNLRAFRDPRSIPIAEAFDAWLQNTMALDSAERLGAGAGRARRASSRGAPDPADGGRRRRRFRPGGRRLQRHVRRAPPVVVSLWIDPAEAGHDDCRLEPSHGDGRIVTK
jgi:aromatic ring-opening dioxygenase catalytic subunit (LigB family)